MLYEVVLQNMLFKEILKTDILELKHEQINMAEARANFHNPLEIFPTSFSLI